MHATSVEWADSWYLNEIGRFGEIHWTHRWYFFVFVQEPMEQEMPSLLALIQLQLLLVFRLVNPVHFSSWSLNENGAKVIFSILFGNWVCAWYVAGVFWFVCGFDCSNLKVSEETGQFHAVYSIYSFFIFRFMEFRFSESSANYSNKLCQMGIASEMVRFKQFWTVRLCLSLYGRCVCVCVHAWIFCCCCWGVCVCVCIYGCNELVNSNAKKIQKNIF